MQTNSKIEAFTLSEIVVVLILTSIVVGLAFSVLSLVQKHMADIQNNFSQILKVNKLEQSLWIDFNRYSSIDYNEYDGSLKFAIDIDSVTYQFHKDYIIKSLDTFHIQVQSKSFFFDGNQVENGAIDALELRTSPVSQNQVLFVFKKNDATAFMN